MIQTATINEITDNLQGLPPEKLAVVLDFVAFLKQRGTSSIMMDDEPSGMDCMLAAESALRANWDTPEEDAAWAHLSEGK